MRAGSPNSESLPVRVSEAGRACDARSISVRSTAIARGISKPASVCMCRMPDAGAAADLLLVVTIPVMGQLSFGVRAARIVSLGGV